MNEKKTYVAPQGEVLSLASIYEYALGSAEAYTIDYEHIFGEEQA